MSIQAGALIIAIAIIRAIALNELPKTTFLVLWGIVLVRLLVPISISSGFSIYNIAGVASSNAQLAVSAFVTDAILPVNTQTQGQAATPIAPTVFFSISPITVIWLIGVFALLALFIAWYI